MKKLTFLSILIFTTFNANAAWYTLYSAKCNLTNGVLEYSSLDDRADKLTISLGLASKTFETESKVFTTDRKNSSTGTETPILMFSDFSGKYSLEFNMNHKMITQKMKLNNVITKVTMFVPTPAPIWFPVGYQMPVGSGMCDLEIGPFEY
jgi:hypothetical protein